MCAHTHPFLIKVSQNNNLSHNHTLSSSPVFHCRTTKWAWKPTCALTNTAPAEAASGTKAVKASSHALENVTRPCQGWVSSQVTEQSRGLPPARKAGRGSVRALPHTDAQVQFNRPPCLLRFLSSGDRAPNTLLRYCRWPACLSKSSPPCVPLLFKSSPF